MNSNQKIYGPEKFEQAINSLTEKSHPESYYIFFRKALTVCNFLQSVKEKSNLFELEDDFLNSSQILKGDLDIEQFIISLYKSSKTEYAKELAKGFVESYYDLCSYMDNLDERQFTFKEFSYINSKYKEVLRLICDLYIYLKDSKK